MGVHVSTSEDICTCVHTFVEGSPRLTLSVIPQYDSVCRWPEVPQAL